MDMDTRFKDTFLEMEDETVWGTICIQVNRTYGFQTPVNCRQWVTNIITIMETLVLSKAGCLDLKKSIELLKCHHHRHIITGWVQWVNILYYISILEIILYILRHTYNKTNYYYYVITLNIINLYYFFF